MRFKVGTGAPSFPVIPQDTGGISKNLFWGTNLMIVSTIEERFDQPKRLFWEAFWTLKAYPLSAETFSWVTCLRPAQKASAMNIPPLPVKEMLRGPWF